MANGKVNSVVDHVRAEWLAYTVLAALVVQGFIVLGGMFFRDPGVVAVQEAIVKMNEREIADHKSLDAHKGARERLALIEQRQEFMERTMQRVLDATKTNADIGIKTNRLLQDIADKERPLIRK